MVRCCATGAASNHVTPRPSRLGFAENLRARLLEKQIQLSSASTNAYQCAATCGDRMAPMKHACLWKKAKQVLYACRPVTGDFLADVTPSPCIIRSFRIFPHRSPKATPSGALDYSGRTSSSGLFLSHVERFLLHPGIEIGNIIAIAVEELRRNLLVGAEHALGRLAPTGV
jgi:hypothetical protein